MQCHGVTQASWRAGVHGKRVGNWWGEREVWTCVSCHRPHAPHFRSIEPKPPPVRPEHDLERIRGETQDVLDVMRRKRDEIRGERPAHRGPGHTDERRDVEE